MKVVIAGNGFSGSVAAFSGRPESVNRGPIEFVFNAIFVFN